MNVGTQSGVGSVGVCTYHVKDVLLDALSLVVPAGPVVTSTSTMI